MKAGYKKQVNNVWKAINEGRPALGTCIYTREPAMVEVFGEAGFDFVILDTEHVRVNYETLENQIRAAENKEMTAYVRVAWNEPYLIRYAMEAGAQGVIVPHVTTKEECQKAQDALRYPPHGIAGTCPYIRSAAFEVNTFGDYLEGVNEIPLMPIIEDVKAMDDLDGILDVLKPGRDMVWFGRADYAMSMSIYKDGKMDLDPAELYADADKIIAACKKRNLPIMTTPMPVTSHETARDLLEKGYNIIEYGVDLTLMLDLAKGVSAFCKTLKNK